MEFLGNFSGYWRKVSRKLVISTCLAHRVLCAINWQASKASETLFGVYKFELMQYAYIYTYIYVYDRL